MQVSAAIIKGSSVDRLWRGENRVGGELAGVAFRLAGNLQGGEYVAESLTPDQVAALAHNPAARLETITEPVGAAAAIEPPPAPVPARSLKTPQPKTRKSK